MTDYYPGSKQKVRNYRRDPLPPLDDTEKLDLGTPRIYSVHGREVEFFTLGVLAFALNRKPVTIRKWEADGVLPKPRAVTPVSDPRGRRRLYTKGQILGLVKIAEEEGILLPSALGKWRDVTKTRFTERAVELFKTLEIE